MDDDRSARFDSFALSGYALASSLLLRLVEFGGVKPQFAREVIDDALLDIERMLAPLPAQTRSAGDRAHALLRETLRRLDAAFPPAPDAPPASRPGSPPAPASPTPPPEDR